MSSAAVIGDEANIPIRAGARPNGLEEMWSENKKGYRGKLDTYGAGPAAAAACPDSRKRSQKDAIPV
jgi:hypothetical protein